MFPRLRFALTLAFVLGLVLAGCTLPGGSPTNPTAAPPPTKAPAQRPTRPPTQAPTTAPQPTAAPQNQACTLTATADVTIYHRPSAQSAPFGNMPAGMTVTPAYRTQDGWFGFDPGVAQAGNVGIFRMRWVFQGDSVQISGNCDQLPLAPPLPAGVCFLMPMEAVNVYANPSAQSAIIGSLSPEEYAEAIGRGPHNWVQVNLDSGNNTLSGTGWVSLDKSGLNGPCGDLPHVNGGQRPSPTPAQNGGGNGNAGNNDNGEIRIQFAVGATSWQNPVDAHAPGYVFTAMQGQSVEILVMQGDQPADAALALAAPNGEPLQTYNVGRADWRGVLPQSGDYHLSIAAPNGTNGMTLIVTIYPLPGDPQTVTDTGVGYTLTYDGHYFHTEQPGVFPNEVFGLNLAYTDFLMNTNLEAAYFVMALEPINDADVCLNTPPEGIAVQEAVDVWRINGVDYRHYYGQEAAAGHAYTSDIFRTYIHSRCITVYLFVHTTNIHNYDPGTVTPYDEQGVMDELKRVFFTLQWP